MLKTSPQQTLKVLMMSQRNCFNLGKFDENMNRFEQGENLKVTQVFIIKLCLVIYKVAHSHFHQEIFVFFHYFFGKVQHQNSLNLHLVKNFIPFCFNDVNKFWEFHLQVKLGLLLVR